jgi:hypothetical protein
VTRAADRVPVASIDELLHPVDEEPERPRLYRLRSGWWLGNALVIAVLTGLAVEVERGIGVRLPLVLVVGGLVALRVVWHVAAGAAAPPPPARVPAPPATATDADGRYDFTGSDALRAAVRRWENRLQPTADAARFSRNVLPVLAELTDERLRQRHGVTRVGDPARARALLGEPLWGLLADPRRRAPKAKEWAILVDALEKL